MTLIRLRTIRHRLSVGVLAIAASVLLSGCPPQEPADDEYPNLEAAMASIDWLGNGTPPDSVHITPGGRLPITVTASYGTTDNVALQLVVEDRLKSLPTVFPLRADGKYSAIFEQDDWQVYVARDAASDGTPLVSISVDIVDDDGRAVRSLAPIVEVLGTIP